jgi:hypothetical protein
MVELLTEIFSFAKPFIIGYAVFLGALFCVVIGITIFTFTKIRKEHKRWSKY